MKLRTHPLMSYRGVSNWPSAWVGTNERHKPLRGERGILQDVVPSQTENASRFFLVIEDEGSQYVGCLLFQDLSFCRQIYKLMIAHRGHTIFQSLMKDILDIVADSALSGAIIGVRYCGRVRNPYCYAMGCGRQGTQRL